MEKGYLCLVLHAHLPYVRHPEHEHYLEERWLFEAITETYIPLLKVFEQLAEEGVAYRITMSLTPPLLSMLNDQLLQDRYLKHLEKLIELAAKEIERTRWLPEFNRMAHYYHDLFTFSRWYFAEKCQKNLVTPFRRLQDAGYLELITSGATHGYLPLMLHREAVRAQVHYAVEYHTCCFGRPPRGFGCPNAPIIRGTIDPARLRPPLFFTDAHGILHASPPQVRELRPRVLSFGGGLGRDLNPPNKSGVPRRLPRRFRLPGILP